MNMAKRPVEKYDFKALGEAMKAAFFVFFGKIFRICALLVGQKLLIGECPKTSMRTERSKKPVKGRKNAGVLLCP